MTLDDYRILFLVVILGLALIAASPVLALVLPQDGNEGFSNFWMLGSDHMAEGYPSNVVAEEEYNVFIGVENQMGDSEYYMVILKFGNSSQSFPNVDGFVPSTLLPLYEYRFFVGNGEVWESPVNFSFQDVVVDGDVLSIGKVVVDGISLPVNAYTHWTAERNGFYFQLFFELWRYDVSLKSFSFDNRFVGLWLNMTGF
jgi:uncharacterized membrane protein